MIFIKSIRYSLISKNQLYSEELGMRSEEWWKGRIIHKAPQYPFLKKRQIGIKRAASFQPTGFVLRGCEV